MAHKKPKVKTNLTPSLHDERPERNAPCPCGTKKIIQVAKAGKLPKDFIDNRDGTISRPLKFKECCGKTYRLKAPFMPNRNDPIFTAQKKDGMWKTVHEIVTATNKKSKA